MCRDNFCVQRKDESGGQTVGDADASSRQQQDEHGVHDAPEVCLNQTIMTLQKALVYHESTSYCYCFWHHYSRCYLITSCI